jgi:hypothetical protein
MEELWGLGQGDLRRISHRILQSDAQVAEQLCKKGGPWRKHNIQAVLYVGHGKRLPYATELRVLSLPIGNDELVCVAAYDLAADFHLRTSYDQHTLVHCNAGVNRSVAFAALLLYVDGGAPSIEHALRAVRRGPTYPSEPLCTSLRDWEAHSSERAALLRKAGAL